MNIKYKKDKIKKYNLREKVNFGENYRRYRTGPIATSSSAQVNRHQAIPGALSFKIQK